MGFVYEERLSDSPYLETITQGYTEGSGSVIRPSEVHWHMVFVKWEGELQPLLTGPLTTSGIVSFTEGVELLWVKFKLGTYMPHMPAKNFLNAETRLPDASSKSFWLKGSAWQFPHYENVETFVEWLAHDGLLVRDPVVNAALQDELIDTPTRTIRHRFAQTTGLTQNYIRQHERAQQAASLLRHGKSILDTVYETGYFDQPHLTRALKQFVGYTPAQLIQSNNP